MRRGVVIRSLVLAAFFTSLATGAEAQYRTGSRGFLGVSFVAANPVGDFGSYVEQGFGGQIDGGVAVDPAGHVRMRGDLGFIVYGHERLTYCSTLSCRVASDLTTTNSIVYGGFGPELSLGTGAVEPYVHAGVGLTGLITSSSVDDHDGYGPYLQTTNYSDVVFGWTAGAGLRMRLGNGHKPVYLDLAVERRDNGVADYLTRGDIVDNPDGSITVYPNRSETDLMTFRVGVTFGFPRYAEGRRR